MKLYSLIAGTALSIITFFTISSLGLNVSLACFVVTSGIASIYFGSSLVSNKINFILIEGLVMVSYWLLLIVSFNISLYFAVLLLFLHAIWDLLHEYKFIRTKVNNWYPIFCASFDIVLAFLFLFVGEKNVGI